LLGYMKALGERSKHVRGWMLFLERYPLVVGPVSTEPPFQVGFDTTTAERSREVSRAQRLLVAVNLLGLPAVAVPAGRAGGLPPARSTVAVKDFPGGARIEIEAIASV